MAKPTENPVADLLRARGLPSLVIALTHLDAAALDAAALFRRHAGIGSGKPLSA